MPEPAGPDDRRAPARQPGRFCTTEPFPRADLPDLTVDQMREVDRIMIDDLGIGLLQMMENAGRNLADLAIRRYAPATTTVLTGPGGNGGGGLVAARHLRNRGVAVHVVLAAADRMSDVPAHQLRILEHMDVPVVDSPPSADLVIDALLGYSLRGDPRGRAAGLIDWANGQPAAVLALDTPSGLELTTGRIGSPCVTADATLTLALPKAGLRRAPQVVGRLFAADITVPPSVYERLGVAVTAPFAADAIVRVA